ncbi:MAG: GAF domain-containing protein [Methylobacteriaceae bacterium]|nr:GAF domain-containing protein [Methylobacteriaceae bacterium]
MQDTDAALQARIDALTRDLEEARAQQTATTGVLKVISRSAFDLQPVLDTLTQSATTLCNATQGIIFLRDGDVFRAQVAAGAGPELVKHLHANPLKAGRGAVASRVALSGTVEQIPDVLADPEYALPALRRFTDTRAVLGVPLLRDGRIEGIFVLGRNEPGPFTERQVELVQTFADQAVIAIGNVRLFEEVHARTGDLSEALRQQTATADVLKAISRSTFDLKTVLDKLTESAATLCNAQYGLIFLRDGDAFLARASFPSDEDRLRASADYPRRPGRGSVASRVAHSGAVEQIPDISADPEYDLPDKYWFFGSARAVLGAPLLRDGRVEGIFVLGRFEPGAFTQRQVELVQTFADQAVIAIENVRLFEEVQARTREVTEALQQQTATADVLKVISRSAFDLKTVLHTLTASATLLCDATQGNINIRHGDVFCAESAVGADPALLEFLKDHPMKAGRGSVTARVALSGRTEQIPDLLTDREFSIPGLQQVTKARALLGVPLLRDGRVEGVFVLTRPEPGLFTERQVELVQTFADQAVIAIENVRLFEQVRERTHDLQEALEYQTATGDVLKVISRSIFDLQPVLDTLVATATRLCAAVVGHLAIRKGDAYRYVATLAADPAWDSAVRGRAFFPGRGTMAGRALLDGRVVQCDDLAADPEYDMPEAVALGKLRTVVAVPMLREGAPIGVITLGRQHVERFTERQIALLRTFADQAVIAIENVRLFEQVQAKTRELSQSLDDLRSAQDRLIQSEKLASLGQLTAGIAHEIKNPLNFVNNFADLARELLDELKAAIGEAGGSLSEGTRAEIDELAGMITSNLEKVAQHGRRADSIVKNMLMHSREGGGERRCVDLNAVVEESLNLAYHGARAEKQGFNITLSKELDPAVGKIDIYPQEFTRVLLNLISNGFYAAHRKKSDGGGPGFEPALGVSTRALPDHVEIRIRDNGTGISDAVKAKMFNPFFTTKPAGEGTGLGLSLSHDIIVKQHGGTIDVETKLGEYTEFIIALPRAGAPAAEAGGRS